MNSRAAVRDQSMRRAAACSRLERRARACYSVAAAVLIGIGASLALYAFALPCAAGALC